MRDSNVLDLFNRHKAVLEKHCRRVKFAPGDCLFKEGEMGDRAFIIEDGEIVISRIIMDREKAIGVAEAGDIVGEIALFSGNPRTATASTNKNLSVIEINRESVQKLKEENPAVAVELYERILQIITGRLRGAIDHYEVIYNLLS